MQNIVTFKTVCTAELVINIWGNIWLCCCMKHAIATVGGVAISAVVFVLSGSSSAATLCSAVFVFPQQFEHPCTGLLMQQKAALARVVLVAMILARIKTVNDFACCITIL